MRIVFTLLISLLIASCSQKAWTKRGQKNGWIKTETIIDTIVTETVEKDTIFKFYVKDTVILKENKLTVKYFYNTKDSTVYIDGKCDPDTLIVEKEKTTITENSDSGFFDWRFFVLLGILLYLILSKSRFSK